MLKGFEPFICDDTEILIVGTFPGISSLNEKKYYNSNSNSFWKIIAYMLKIKDIPNNYLEKIELLKKLKIGIWDVFSEAERKNPTSLDSDLIGSTVNDFDSFLTNNKKIKIIAFNGQNAEKLFNRHFQLKNKDNFIFITLPSSSNVNTSISFERKCEEWKKNLNL
jgi:hypoxanthine-DNA glycosylase